MRLVVLVTALLAMLVLVLRSDAPEPPAPREAEPTTTAARPPQLIGRPAPAPDESVAPAPSPRPEAEPAAETESIEACEEIPADPVQKGPCAVHISLRDVATGQPTASRVQLWRLNAPANADWGRGDQLQATRWVPEDGFSFVQLPAGRYRIYAEGQPRETKDPPAFKVVDAAGAQVFDIPLPAKRSAVLQIFDETGRQLMDAYRASGPQPDHGGLIVDEEETAPQWITGRELKRDGTFFFEDCAACFECELGEGEVAVSAGPNGFPLDAVVARSRGETVQRRYDFRVDERTGVRCVAGYQGEREHVYQAVTIPIEPIRDAVRLPDGTRAVDQGATIRTYCEATLAKPFRVFDPREHTVSIRVTLASYKVLHFHVRPGDRVSRRTLEPR